MRKYKNMFWWSCRFLFNLTILLLALSLREKLSQLATTVPQWVVSLLIRTEFSAEETNETPPQNTE